MNDKTFIWETREKIARWRVRRWWETGQYETRIFLLEKKAKIEMMENYLKWGGRRLLFRINSLIDMLAPPLVLILIYWSRAKESQKRLFSRFGFWSRVIDKGSEQQGVGGVVFVFFSRFSAIRWQMSRRILDWWQILTYKKVIIIERISFLTTEIRCIGYNYLKDKENR